MREPRQPLRSSEDAVLYSVGHERCKKFSRGYTRKQWGLDLGELSAGVAGRIPTRCNHGDRYFRCRWQLMPAAGYSALFERLPGHPLIRWKPATDFEEPATDVEAARGLGLGLAPHTVYTAAVDAAFGHSRGALPYRGIRDEPAHRPDVDR